MTKILYENGPYWVLKSKVGFYAMIQGITHSVSDSCYDDLNLAVARVDYLAKTDKGNCHLRRAFEKE